MTREAMTVASLLDNATTRIGAALGLEIREARLEARVLAAFAWGVAPAWLIAHDTDLPHQTQISQFGTLLARRLEIAIAQIPDALRTVFVMRDIEGLSIEETSAVLDTPPATVKTRLSRARKRLQAHAGRRSAGSGSGCGTRAPPRRSMQR